MSSIKRFRFHNYCALLLSFSLFQSFDLAGRVTETICCCYYLLFLYNVCCCFCSFIVCCSCPLPMLLHSQLIILHGKFWISHLLQFACSPKKTNSFLITFANVWSKKSEQTLSFGQFKWKNYNESCGYSILFKTMKPIQCSMEFEVFALRLEYGPNHYLSSTPEARAHLFSKSDAINCMPFKIRFCWLL